MTGTMEATAGQHTGQEDILFEVSDSIGTITLNRPQARNALTFEMYDRLAEICSSAADMPGLKVIVVTGAGDKAFAAGTDISRFREFRSADDALAYESRIDAVLTAVETCPLPTIAAMAGACTGGGAAIAATCDLRLATADLRFGFPIARTLGNCLSSASLGRLVALIGAGRTRELIFTSRLVGAEEAKAAGLVSEVFDDAATLREKARELAVKLTGHAPLTLQATKEALRRMRVHNQAAPDEDLITMCYTSEDFREGLEAFLAKRKPDWKGR